MNQVFNSSEKIIKIAILAVGGQGGGVLTNWIVDLAERNGWAAQSTAVAGVAQRTGATIYYIEMAQSSGVRPIFALAPAPGDVDILISAELMEAGRAIMRGFVTSDRTTLIASSHRMLAVSEKIVPGNGIADNSDVLKAAQMSASKVIIKDLDAVARENGSVISSSLFGALAASNALPFSENSYKNTIRASGKGIEASLRSFTAAIQCVEQTDEEHPPTAVIGSRISPIGKTSLVSRWNSLANRIDKLPLQIRDMALAGIKKLVDFQDLDYAGEYLATIETMAHSDNPDENYEFTVQAAKYLANAMAYDDVIRVADLKTRSGRFGRIQQEIGATPEQLMALTEYMHPRASEICATLPRSIGRWIESSKALSSWLERRCIKGRRFESHRVHHFILLYVLGGMKRWRRALLRHEQELKHWSLWLDLANKHRNENYALGVEILKCRRLIKGYGDTHARGQSKFDQVLHMLQPLEGRQDAANWIARLREAALKDVDGSKLEGTIKTIHSFV
ncbi:MAG: indolepyruvate oxidoreductase subunit beta family protein [Cohaesibacteraceae bacterium]|nr:indolepyruvate oxidoreductase subunit beta family protein [Cohaesibacteraceae bacterium]